MSKRKSYGSIKKTTHPWWNNGDVTDALASVHVSKEQIRKAFALTQPERKRRNELLNRKMERMIYKKIK